MKIQDFLTRDIVHNIDPKNKATLRTAIFMWFCLWLGYFLFAANWLVIGRLEGDGSSGGWAAHFGWSKGVATTGSESMWAEIWSNLSVAAPDFLVPLARGLAAIPAAIIIAKLTHKKTCVFSLFLAASALPLVFAPYYPLFLMGRFLMALGGTLLIICTQPIISKFFDVRLKGSISTFNSLAFNLAACTSALLFLYEPIGKALIDNWQILGGILGGLTLLPLIGYFVLGINFEIKHNGPEDEIPVSYLGTLKESITWKWITFFSCLIVVSVGASNKYPGLIQHSCTEIYQSTGSIDWGSIYVVLFYIGASCGILLGWMNQYKVKKVQALRIFTFITLCLWLVIILSTTLLTSVPLFASILIFIAIFFVGFCGIGLLSVALYIPHEFTDFNPKKVSIFFSLLWGFSYIAYALFVVILTALKSVHVIAPILFLTMIIYGYYFTSFLLKEPVDSYKNFTLNFKSWERK